MKSKSIPVLYFDIIRDVLSNFDRKGLFRLMIINKRFNLIINQEFNANPPYLIMSTLNRYNSQWTMKVGNNLREPVDLTVFQKIIASKFIRFRQVHIDCDAEFHPMQLLTMSHLWQNGNLSVIWAPIQIIHSTEEFNRSFSNCSELFVYGNSAIAILHGVNSGSYRTLQVCDDGYNPISQEIPWMKIIDFLFRKDENSDSYNYIDIETNHPPKREKTVEFINSLKERFETAEIGFDLYFSWSASFKKKIFRNFVVQNNQTKQCLTLNNNCEGFTIYSSSH
ncbi:hypothetical protein Ddc_06577 [Ditylenchus destructor]|nr:hypothetical protein Ddc_06577 [Ditylenchus destructor]